MVERGLYRGILYPVSRGKKFEHIPAEFQTLRHLAMPLQRSVKRLRSEDQPDEGRQPPLKRQAI